MPNAQSPPPSPAQSAEPSPAQSVHHILQNYRTVAVVGLSPKPARDSWQVAHYMQKQGWRIVPVNPIAAAENAQILGETVYASLGQAAQALAARGEKIELVDCFRNSADIPPVAAEAIAIGAHALWMQLGVAHAEAAALARTAGLWVVENRCLEIDHMASLRAAKLPEH